MNNRFYIYFHFINDTDQLFYIGKGSGNRHISKVNRNVYWKNIVNKHGYYPVIIQDNLSEENSFELERIYIKIFKHLLVNQTDGGEGVSGRDPWNKGLTNIYSEETKEKISKSNIGKHSGPKS